MTEQDFADAVQKLVLDGRAAGLTDTDMLTELEGIVMAMRDEQENGA